MFTDGRFTGTHRVRGALRADPGSHLSTDHVGGSGSDIVEVGPAVSGRLLTAELLGVPLGQRATLLQFSSAFCAPCRTTRHVLAEVAGSYPDVAHVEIDAEAHLELVRSLSITRTPTTLVLDKQGAEVVRAAGAPRKQDVLAVLAGIS
ncbi:MAG: thioredoxin family protein [Nocardioidaceae bacterium]|nr:MAG: thioredoxin family protein [Nocardioidaceae bacterium]